MTTQEKARKLINAMHTLAGEYRTEGNSDCSLRIEVAISEACSVGEEGLARLYDAINA